VSVTIDAAGPSQSTGETLLSLFRIP